MRVRNDLMTLGASAALGLLSACSGGGGADASSGLQQGQSPGGATLQRATVSYQLSGAAHSYDLPPLAGFGGALSLPATTVAPDTRLELTSSLQAPADAPTVAGSVLRPQNTGTLNIYFYTTIRVSATVTFPSLSGFSVTLPTTTKPSGLQFFYAISDPKPANGAEVQFRTEGPATVSGPIVTFAPSTTALTLNAGQPYTIAFYAISAIAGNSSPTPAPASKIYVADFGSAKSSNGGTVTTYTPNGTPTTPTITGLSFPDGIAVDAAGKIYVTNARGNDLATYTADGVRTDPTITGLNFPTGVAVDAGGKIYVANLGNNTVTTYTAAGVRTTPTITAGLSSPFGVAVDAAGKIYVANENNDTVTTYTADGARTTPTITVMSLPTGVAIGPDGSIYVASPEGSSLYMTSPGDTMTIYDANGTLIHTITAAGLNLPIGVAVDASGKVYVANGGGTVTTYTAAGVQTTPTITGFNAPIAIAVH